MSGESKKPQITRADKKSEATPVVEKKKTRSEKRKEAKEAKAKKRRAEDATTRRTILRKQKEQKKQKTHTSATRVDPKSDKGRTHKTTEGKPAIVKGRSLATTAKEPDGPAKKDSRKSKKGRKKSKKVQKTKRVRASKKMTKKSKLIIIGGMVAVLLLVGLNVDRNSGTTGHVSSDSTTSGLLGDSDSANSNNRPDFVRVVPTTSAGDLRSHYDPDRGFYTFQEEFYSKLITVNQQPIPSDFKLSADILLAQTEYATIGRFESEKGLVYVARSDDGPHHAVAFVFNNLLIFITTTQAITDEQWLEYINSL